MTEILHAESPICEACGAPTDVDLYDADMGQICSPCAQAAAIADRILDAAGITKKTNRKPKH